MWTSTTAAVSGVSAAATVGGAQRERGRVDVGEDRPARRPAAPPRRSRRRCSPGRPRPGRRRRRAQDDLQRGGPAGHRDRVAAAAGPGCAAANASSNWRVYGPSVSAPVASISVMPRRSPPGPTAERRCALLGLPTDPLVSRVLLPAPPSAALSPLTACSWAPTVHRGHCQSYPAGVLAACAGAPDPDMMVPGMAPRAPLAAACPVTGSRMMPDMPPTMPNSEFAPQGRRAAGRNAAPARAGPGWPAPRAPRSRPCGRARRAGLTALGPVRRALFPRLAGQGDAGHVALTFDDGPDPAATPGFLDLLGRAAAAGHVLPARLHGGEGPGLAGRDRRRRPRDRRARLGAPVPDAARPAGDAGRPGPRQGLITAATGARPGCSGRPTAC